MLREIYNLLVENQDKLLLIDDAYHNDIQETKQNFDTSMNIIKIMRGDHFLDEDEEDLKNIFELVKSLHTKSIIELILENKEYSEKENISSLEQCVILKNKQLINVYFAILLDNTKLIKRCLIKFLDY